MAFISVRYSAMDWRRRFSGSGIRVRTICRKRPRSVMERVSQGLAAMA